MRRGFTLLEVLIATIILGVGLTTVIISMSQAQQVMLGSTYLETAQEVMDLGDMAYPLADVTDPEDELEVEETRASELWEKISDIRLTDAQDEKIHGYTWKREWLNKNDDEEIERLGGLHIGKVTGRWGDGRRGNHEEESYVTFWRKPEE